MLVMFLSLYSSTLEAHKRETKSCCSLGAYPILSWTDLSEILQLENRFVALETLEGHLSTSSLGRTAGNMIHGDDHFSLLRVKKSSQMPANKLLRSGGCRAQLLYCTVLLLLVCQLCQPSPLRVPMLFLAPCLQPHPLHHTNPQCSLLAPL